MTVLLGWCRMEFRAALMPQDNPLGSTESRVPRDRSEADGSPSGSAESNMDTPRGSGRGSPSMAGRPTMQQSNHPPPS